MSELGKSEFMAEGKCHLQAFNLPLIWLTVSRDQVDVYFPILLSEWEHPS